MVTLTICTKIRPHKRREFLQTVAALRKDFQQVQGCLSYHAFQDAADENMVYLVTGWQTQDDLEHHFQTRKFNVLLGAMHILAETSELKINDSSPMTDAECAPSEVTFDLMKKVEHLQSGEKALL
jgi:quinol monooxygenase YgiN